MEGGGRWGREERGSWGWGEGGKGEGRGRWGSNGTFWGGEERRQEMMRYDAYAKTVSNMADMRMPLA